jgi:hypothetical protein
LLRPAPSRRVVYPTEGSPDTIYECAGPCASRGVDSIDSTVRQRSGTGERSSRGSFWER